MVNTPWAVVYQKIRLHSTHCAVVQSDVVKHPIKFKPITLPVWADLSVLTGMEMISVSDTHYNFLLHVYHTCFRRVWSAVPTPLWISSELSFYQLIILQPDSKSMALSLKRIDCTDENQHVERTNNKQYGAVTHRHKVKYRSALKICLVFFFSPL